MTKKRILILTANPTDTLRLRLDKEKREIDEGLRRAQRRDEFEVEARWANRPQDLRRAMLEFIPNIVHFCGHGEGEAGIILEDETGQAQLVNTEALAGLFELFADSVECVVLNACYSAVQAEVIAQHIGYVIGMAQAIKDTTAIEFAVAFYDTLGAGRSVKFAYELACKAAQLIGNLTPILLIRRSVATAFWAYNPEKQEFVEQAATALCQRGVVPWLNTNNLPSGTDFIERLTTALRQKVVMVPVLSTHKEDEEEEPEVRDLLELKKKALYPDWIVPVYLEDREEPASVAERISQYIYQRLKFKNAKDINIVIDQRGDGSRKEPYEFPQPDTPELRDKLATLSTYPTLVFKPDLGERSRTQLLIGEEWKHFHQTVKHSLLKTLDNLTTKKDVRILGEFQLGIGFLLGQYFDRTTPVTLYCYNTRYNTCFDNEGQERHGPLSGGNSHCEITTEDEDDESLPPKIRPGEIHPTVALYVGKRKFLHDVKVHLGTEQPRLPLVFVETIKPDESFKDSEQVMKLVRDVVALLFRLKDQNDTTTIRLYCDLPNNVVPLLSANLTWQVMSHIEFMERDPQARSPQEMYVHLPMK